MLAKTGDLERAFQHYACVVLSVWDGSFGWLRRWLAWRAPKTAQRRIPGLERARAERAALLVTRERLRPGVGMTPKRAARAWAARRQSAVPAA
jgi:hypothetical protein